MTDPNEPDDIIEEDIGGVQGEDDRPEIVPKEDGSDGPLTVQAPDAGEIEWAGGLIKKAPRSAD